MQPTSAAFGLRGSGLEYVRLSSQQSPRLKAHRTLQLSGADNQFDIDALTPPLTQYLFVSSRLFPFSRR